MIFILQFLGDASPLLFVFAKNATTIMRGENKEGETMLNIIKRIGDLFVVVLLIIGFGLMFRNNVDPTYWDTDEWLVFAVMVWTTLRFASELIMILIKKAIEEVKEEIKKDLIISK